LSPEQAASRVSAGMAAATVNAVLIDPTSEIVGRRE
jgi:hypothetical protein